MYICFCITRCQTLILNSELRKSLLMKKTPRKRCGFCTGTDAGFLGSVGKNNFLSLQMKDDINCIYISRKNTTKTITIQMFYQSIASEVASLLITMISSDTSGTVCVEGLGFL